MTGKKLTAKKHIEQTHGRERSPLSKIFPLEESNTTVITEGMAFGFISYSILKAVRGKGLEVHWAFHVISVAFVARYVLLR